MRRPSSCTSGVSGSSIYVCSRPPRPTASPVSACRRSGLSVARNAALARAHADGAEVVSYLDDDAIPAEGWLSNLAAHWAAAPPELACIGGAIDPIWSVEPPEWMSDEIGVVFSLLDRGPGTKPLQPGVEDASAPTSPSASRRWRRRGGLTRSRARGNIPFFADETEAQRRLAELGYRGLYAGDAPGWPCGRGGAPQPPRGPAPPLLRRGRHAARRPVGPRAGLARLLPAWPRRRLLLPSGARRRLASRRAASAPARASLMERRVRRRLESLHDPPTGFLRIALLHAHDLSEVRRGTERLVDDLGSRLAKRAHEVTAITAHEGPARFEHREGVECGSQPATAGVRSS